MNELEHWARPGISSSLHPELPPWDRTVDIVCHRYENSDSIPTVDLDAILDEAALEKVFPEHLNVQRISADGQKKLKGYNDLPISIRRRICSYLVQEQNTPVTLSHLAFTRPAWSLQSLTPFPHAYESIKPYILSSPFMRMDILLTFLSVNTFHVTLSPHVGPRVSPLATEWLVKYGAWMEKIILEIDMTKLGLGAAEGVDMLFPGLNGVQQLVREFAASQEERKIPLRELTLLCRRYYGERGSDVLEGTNRSSGGSNNTASSKGSNSSHHSSTAPLNPNKASNVSNESHLNSTSEITLPDTPIPAPLKIVKSPATPRFTPYYCPNYHLPLLNALYVPLHNKVHALRMCGFSQKYTHALLRSLFPVANGRCVFRLGPSNGAWPRLVGQRSWVDNGNGNEMIDVVEEDDGAQGFVWVGSKMPPRPTKGADGILRLPAPPREKFYGDLNRCMKSVKSTGRKSAASSTRTMSKGERFRRFMAGASGKAESIRDSGSSKGSKEEKLAVMTELPGYI